MFFSVEMIFNIMILFSLVSTKKILAKKRIRTDQSDVPEYLRTVFDPYGHGILIIGIIQTLLAFIPMIDLVYLRNFKYSAEVYTILILIGFGTYSLTMKMSSDVLGKKWVSVFLLLMSIYPVLMIGYIIVIKIINNPDLDKVGFFLMGIFVLLVLIEMTFIVLFTWTICTLKSNVQIHEDDFDKGIYYEPKIGIYRFFENIFIDKKKVLNLFKE